MSKFELTKTIEARKLNKRSGLPLPEPPVTISFGSIIENLKEAGRMGRFTYLFDLYESEYARLESALKPVGAETPEPPAKPAKKGAVVAIAAAAAAPAAAPELKFLWDE